MSDVTQFAVDIEDDGNIDEEEIAKILEDAGLIVLGTAWKASWTEDDYHHSRPPYASD